MNFEAVSTIGKVARSFTPTFCMVGNRMQWAKAAGCSLYMPCTPLQGVAAVHKNDCCVKCNGKLINV